MKKTRIIILLLIIATALTYFFVKKYQDFQEENEWSQVHSQANAEFWQKVDEYKLKDVSLLPFTYYRGKTVEEHYSDLICSNLDECIFKPTEILSLRNNLITRVSYEGKECDIVIRKIVCGEDEYSFYQGAIYKNGVRINKKASSDYESNGSSTSNNNSSTNNYSSYKKSNSSKRSSNKSYDVRRDYEDADDYAEDNWEEYSDDYEEGYEEAYDDWE